MEQKPEKKHYEGHRERLKKRFLETNAIGFNEYELLELLLFKSIPRIDTKPLAKALLNRFGSISGVLSADIKMLQEVKGCGKSTATDLKIIYAIHKLANKEEIVDCNIFNSTEKVLAYFKAVLAYEPIEQFRVMYLNKIFFVTMQFKHAIRAPAADVG